MIKARITSEYHLRVGDNVGAGADVFRQLRDAGVRVVATCCYRINNEAHLSFIPGTPHEAAKVLAEEGFDAGTEDVLLVELNDEPGAFSQVLDAIAALGVQANSAYVTPAPSADGPSLAVIKTDDNAKVIAAFGEETKAS
jgi:hypothetical protein